TYWHGLQLIAIYGRKRGSRKQPAADLLPRRQPGSLSFDLRGVEPQIIPALLAGLRELSRDKRQFLRNEKALRAALDERETALAIADGRIRESVARADASATRESAARGEIDRLRMLVAGLTRQRDAAMLAAAETVRDEIAALRDGLTQTERETAEQRQALTEGERKAGELERSVAELTHAVARGKRGAIRRLAEHLWERVRRRGVKALVGAGDRARDAGNWVLAALHYRCALARAPDLAPIWVQLGHA